MELERACVENVADVVEAAAVACPTPGQSVLGREQGKESLHHALATMYNTASGSLTCAEQHFSVQLCPRQSAAED